MKALILEQNAKERSLIQHVLEKSGHAAILGRDMDEAWQWIENGETRFIIADGDAEDFKKSNLIGRARAAKILPVYFLILTAGEEDNAEADDNLHKPIAASELKARIMIGQRFLLLGESLSHARDQLESLALYELIDRPDESQRVLSERTGRTRTRPPQLVSADCHCARPR